MAKKQPANPTPETAPAPGPAAEEPRKGDEPKKGKEPRAKEGKAREAKAKPDATPAPPAPAPAAATPGAAPAPAGEAAAKKKGKRPGKSPRPGKKLRGQLKNLRQKLAKETPAPLKRAVALLKQVKRAKFDETVEVHMSLGIDTTQSEQMIRGSVSLPHGVGKTVRVVVFCQGDNVEKAKGAGADDAGGDDLIKRVQDGWLDFDVALATQDMMGKVSRLGKTLGPRGLMPTPKAGTVITAGGDVSNAVKEFKAGKVEYRTDKGGNVHAGVGKMSFDDDKLAANITAFVDQIKAVKPSGVKGHYVKSITVSGTMTPGIGVTM
jgi:large subunit ribosomal protein L1